MLKYGVEYGLSHLYPYFRSGLSTFSFYKIPLFPRLFIFAIIRLHQLFYNLEVACITDRRFERSFSLSP